MTTAPPARRRRLSEISRAELEERHRLDLGIACPYRGCGAGAGEGCRDVIVGAVHFQRRVRRLLSEQQVDQIVGSVQTRGTGEPTT